MYRYILLFIGLIQCFQSQAQNYNFENINRKVQTWIDSGYYKGASMLVAKDGQTIYKKYWGNYDEQTVAYIASAGKWLAAATIAAVVDEGKLSWDDQVKKWLPNFKDAKGDASLRQLFSHTSGFTPYQPKGKHPDNYQNLQQAVDSIALLPLDYPTGTMFDYGGLAMQVAGRMVELATGKDWESVFQEKIAIPLNMKQTHFSPVDETPGHNPMLGGGARSTLQDYGNFLNMIFNNGLYEDRRILSEKAIAEMQADQIGKAEFRLPEFPQMVRTARHHGVYGLGEWREEVDENGTASLISSPSWAGAYPWIDKRDKVYGFFLTRVNRAKDGFSSFLASPVLSYMVRDVLAKSVEADIKTGWIKLGKDKLYYEELGSGEPLILVHGHSLDHRMWDGQFREFAQHFRVIRYDLRGYGRSSMPSENKPFLHAEDLDVLIQQLGLKKVHLVGLSLGGFVALDYLCLHPENVLSANLVSGNIFPVNGPDKPWTDDERVKRKKEIEELCKKGIDQYKREWFNSLMKSGGSKKEKMRDELWRMIYEWDAWQPLHCEPRLVLGNSIVECLSKKTITQPVFIIEGKSETNHVNEHPQILDLIKSAKLQYIEDAGHMLNMEQKEAFNQLVLRNLNKKNK